MTDSVASDLAAFGRQTEQERQESFEASTLSLVLRQLGWSNGQARKYQNDLAEGFGWDWFNELATLEMIVGSTRIPEFNFEALWLKPRKHPITEAWQEFEDRKLLQGLTGALVFRCVGLGRLVATNLPIDDETHTFINVARDPRQPYCVLPFTDFFTPWKDDRNDQ
jgi:hypothetical protein